MFVRLYPKSNLSCTNHYISITYHRCIVFSIYTAIEISVFTRFLGKHLRNICTHYNPASKQSIQQNPPKTWGGGGITLTRTNKCATKLRRALVTLVAFHYWYIGQPQTHNTIKVAESFAHAYPLRNVRMYIYICLACPGHPTPLNHIHIGHRGIVPHQIPTNQLPPEFVMRLRVLLVHARHTEVCLKHRNFASQTHTRTSTHTLARARNADDQSVTPLHI